MTDVIAEIEQRRAGRHLLLLSDFDGTLAPFHADPGAVVLDRDLHAALSALAHADHTTLGIVSGRRLSDLQQRVSLPACVYLAGSHGLEIEGPDARFRHPDAARAIAALRVISEAVAPRIGHLSGVFVEDKETAIALHYREASADGAAVALALFAEAAATEVEAGRLRLMPGACVLEALPAVPWDKGDAVDWIRERVERTHGRSLAVYLGDDVTDEAAFRAVGLEGIAIAASDRASGAAFTVDGPEGARRVLLSLAGRRRDAGPTAP